MRFLAESASAILGVFMGKKWDFRMIAAHFFYCFIDKFIFIIGREMWLTSSSNLKNIAEKAHILSESRFLFTFNFD